MVQYLKILGEYKVAVNVLNKINNFHMYDQCLG